MQKVISTDKAPSAIGPYSQAIEINNMVYTSGVIPVIPATGEIAEGGVEAQAEQAFQNLCNLVEILKCLLSLSRHFRISAILLRLQALR